MSKYELVILGSGGVGKSAITIQFIQGNFVEKYDPTIEDSYRKDVVVDGESCMLDILDTAGQEEYEGMRDEYMRSGQGFILVYSITDSASCHDLEEIHSKLLKAKDAEGDEVPVILVGNKCDLDSERQVKENEGKEMAKRFGRYTKFIEASAKSRINIDDIFTEMIRLINRLNRGEPPEGEEEETAGAGEGGDSGVDGGDAGGDGGADADGDKGGEGQKSANEGGDGGDGGDGKQGGESSSAGGVSRGGSTVKGSGNSSAGGSSQSRKGKRRKKTVIEVDPSQYTNMMSALPSASHRVSGNDGKKSIICYDFDADKSENLSTTQVSEIPDAGDWAVRWVSIEGSLTNEDASDIVSRFNIHPVATDDLLNSDVHPRLNLYGNSVHIASAVFSRADPQAPFTVHPVDIFLCDRAVVTHTTGAAESLSVVKAQISDASSPVRKNGPAFLVYQILLALSNSAGPVADTFRDELSEIETQALSMPNTELLKKVYVLRREVSLLAKHIQPMIEVLKEIEQECNGSNQLLEMDQRPYFTSVKNKLRNVADVLSTYSDMCDSLVNIKAEATQSGGKGCLLM